MLLDEKELEKLSEEVEEKKRLEEERILAAQNQPPVIDELEYVRRAYDIYAEFSKSILDDFIRIGIVPKTVSVSERFDRPNESKDIYPLPGSFSERSSYPSKLFIAKDKNIYVCRTSRGRDQLHASESYYLFDRGDIEKDSKKTASNPNFYTYFKMFRYEHNLEEVWYSAYGEDYSIMEYVFSDRLIDDEDIRVEMKKVFVDWVKTVVDRA